MPPAPPLDPPMTRCITDTEKYRVVRERHPPVIACGTDVSKEEDDDDDDYLLLCLCLTSRQQLGSYGDGATA